MPIYTRFTASKDTVTEPPFEPGQQVSIDGGIDSSRNIIAMILAIGKGSTCSSKDMACAHRSVVLFIGVVISYQYLENTLAQREREAHLHPQPRRTVKKNRSQAGISLPRRLLRAIQNFFQRRLDPSRRDTAASISSMDSLSSLLKFRPHPHRKPSKRKTIFTLPCLPSTRGKRVKKRPPRPLFLKKESTYVYTPKSPMDEKIGAILRSPDAFAEFQDPVRNLNFQRNDAEAQIRGTRLMSPTTYDRPTFSIDRPAHVLVEPLAFRKKKNSENGTSPIRAPEFKYLDHELLDPIDINEPVSPFSDFTSHSYTPMQHSELSMIEEAPEPSPSSFFHHDDSSEIVVHKRHRHWFSLPLTMKKPTRSADVFSIGSLSESEEERDLK